MEGKLFKVADGCFTVLEASGGKILADRKKRGHKTWEITKLVKRTKLCADNFDSERVADIRARNITHLLSKTTERAVVLETEP